MWQALGSSTPPCAQLSKLSVLSNAAAAQAVCCVKGKTGQGLVPEAVETEL